MARTFEDWWETIPQLLRAKARNTPGTILWKIRKIEKIRSVISLVEKENN